MPAQQYPTAVRMHDQRRRRDVQWSRPAPGVTRIDKGTYPIDVGKFGRGSRPVVGEDVDDCLVGYDHAPDLIDARHLQRSDAEPGSESHPGAPAPQGAGPSGPRSARLERLTESCPSPVCDGQMEGEDSLDEARDPGGRAAEFAEEPSGLEGGDGLFDQGPHLRMGPVDGPLAGGEAAPPAAGREADRAARAPVALVRPAVDAGRARASMMPCSRAARTSWTAPARAGEAHRRRPFGSAMTCRFMPCFLCLPRVEGTVGGDPVDRQKRPVQDQIRLHRSGPYGGERGGEGGQD